MAGLFGYGTRPGKGVKKGEPQKKRFFQFFDLLGRKKGALIKLNLLTFICCIPIITIGPAIAAMTQITKLYVEEKHVFLITDFFDAFKKNFVQGFFMSIITVLVPFLLLKSFSFYYYKIYSDTKLYIIPTFIIFIFSVIFIMMTFYTFLLIVTLKLNLFQIIKNSFMLAVLGSRTNLITMFFTTIVVFASFSFFPFSLILFVFISLSLISLISNYNSFQYVYRYLIKPYYENSGIENPYEREENTDAIFEDAT